jgi:outer membrane protein OmpA-like peptidoglycan-associated protein
VIGTTAECEPQYSYELSWSRAGIVVQTLTELGAPAGQLTPEGQGWFDQWHLSEVDENGIYLPGNAAKNRKVVLVLASSEHGCVL